MNLPINSKNIAAIAQQVTSGSAINPTLWACTVVSPLAFILSAITTSWHSIAFFIVGTIPLSLFSGSYVYMLYKNPKLLRSESFHLRADAIGIFGDKDNPLEADAADVVALATNPALPAPDEQKFLSP